MFNVGGPEFLVILLVALVVLGPTRLPDALRQLGKVIGEARKISTNFQNEVQQAMKDPVKTVTGQEMPKLPKNAKEVVGFAVNEPFKAQKATADEESTDSEADDQASDTSGETEEKPKGPRFNSAEATVPAAEPATPAVPVAPVEAEPVTPSVEPAQIASPAAIQKALETSSSSDDDDDTEVPMFGDR